MRSLHFHFCALIAVIHWLAAIACSAQVYEKVFSFADARIQDLANGGSNNGGYPFASLLQGTDGNFYGTTYFGGSEGLGTVFKMTPGGVVTTLVEFTGNGGTNKGGYPFAGLVQDNDGSLYGTTSSGGASDLGTVFKMTRGGVLTTLVEFTGNGASNKGSNPLANLVQGSDGNFYGTTVSGGANNLGTVFKMTPGGLLTTLVEFTGNGASNKGSGPGAGLVQDNDGSLYGTTSRGGTSDLGTVFKMTQEGLLTTLVEFTGNGASNKGSNPRANLVQGSDGNFYGTTVSGGANNLGTVFKMTPDGVLTTLVEFTGNGIVNKGSGPLAALVLGSDGNFYGTTEQGGASIGSDPNGFGYGTVFKMTPGGMLTTLVELTDNGDSNKGNGPQAGLIQGSDGNLYGTTAFGGSFIGIQGFKFGTVFKMTPDGALTTLVEFTGIGGSEIGIDLQADLVEGSDGSLYGTTYSGGGNYLGTVFKMTPGGELTTLVEFTGNGVGNKGMHPRAGLARGNDGNFYGTTELGGSFGDPNGFGYGTVFKVTPSGVLTTLVEFTSNGASNKGSYPYSGLVLGSDGNFYGTTSSGGANNLGTVFKMTPGGVLTTMVEFADNGASNPQAKLVQGSDGNFYGTTRGGGINNRGTVFKMTPDGVLTTLVEFTGNGVNNKGSNPQAGLVEGSDGNFYGTTSSSGGPSNAGTVFKMTPGGVLTTLVEFTGNGASNKGREPQAGLVQGSDGSFYGTTMSGGANGHGTVFKMTPDGTLTTLVEFTNGSGNPSAPLMLSSEGTLYGTTFESVFRLIVPGPPRIFAQQTEVEAASVAITTQVNAAGSATSVSLEYGTDGVVFGNVVPLAAGISGFQTKLVGTTLNGLSVGATYFYRIRAVSSEGTTVSEVRSFSTLAAPIVGIAIASEIAQTSARFNGTVNARNYDTTVRFEWGTDGNSFPNTANATPVVVVGNSDVSVSVPVAGLVKGTAYYYRIVATNEGGTVVSGTQSFRTLTEPTAVIGGNFALTTTSVRVEGSVNAQGSDSSVVFEYGTDGVSFPNSVAATPASVTGDASTPVSAVLTTLSQGVTYHYRIEATSAGGVGMSNSASFSMNVLSGFTQVFPNAPPESEGFLTVNLTPAGILHGWRFVGEQQWRSSGVPVAGLTTSNREIEFRPVPGHVQPEPEPVQIVSGEAAVYAFDYISGGNTGSGSILVTLKPATLTGAQWRLLGETDSDWRNSDTTLTGLPPGNYLIECKPVAGRATPANVNATVTNGQTASVTITYFLPDAATGTPPAVLSFESVSTDTTRPYAYVGQFRSQVGNSSGFVVKPRVVATAAHVVWDDGRGVSDGQGGSTLAAVQGLQWLFQRYRGVHEPTPLIPRGFYTFDGYAAQRVADNSPGDSSPASQHLDVAAVYFSTNAGRGGHGGFLASDLAENEFLLSNANKMLVGYPIDGISTTSQGRMHATAPFNVVFQAAFGKTFTTSGIRSSGGNSGGPLCVQFEGGAYYPAAIYLGGDDQTVVRAIDSEVVDLFNRAEISSNGGDNNTGGGITHTSISGTTSSTTGSVQIIIEPAEARNAGAGWRLGTSGSYRLSGQVRSSVTPGSYTLSMIPVAGFETPNSPAITVSGGQLITQTYTYAPLMTPQETWRQTYFGSTLNSGDGADNNDFDRDGFTNAQEYAAGTNPTLNGDFFKAENPQRNGSAFSVGTAGKAGRTYVLEWSTTLAPGSWTTVDSAGPLASDAPITLTDAASPPGVALYRIRVTGPAD